MGSSYLDEGEDSDSEGIFDVGNLSLGPGEGSGE